jgi:sulfonate transport system substrate-binding protein
MSINADSHDCSLTRRPTASLLAAAITVSTAAASFAVIDESVVKEVQEASDRATRYGILPKKLDVSHAVDRSFTAAAAGSN